MGALEDVVPLRATRTTGCAFAGPALGLLVITTSAEGLSAADQAAQPDAGRLFTTRVPDVVGRPAFPYRGPLSRLTRAG
jgi:sugar lactone lactonase YvrE